MGVFACNMYFRVYMYMCMCVYVRMCVDLYVYVCVFVVCLYVDMYICIWLCSILIKNIYIHFMDFLLSKSINESTNYGLYN